MTSEQFVKQHFPEAVAGKVKRGGFLAETYWLVYANSDFDNNPIILSRSKSKSNAWVNARKEIQAEKGI